MGVECLGGPHDGAVLRPSFPGDFLWTNGRRCFRYPGRGRVLYRRAQRPGGGEVLLYAQHAYTVCEDCDAFNARLSDTCSLCGGALRVAQG